MKNLKNKLDILKYSNYVIILDNLACHKTEQLKKFYFEQKINIVFNAPYQSVFNNIELFFSLIKNKLYNKLFDSSDEAIVEHIKIIEDKNLGKSLTHNFRETLENYFKYSENHKSINLNNISDI